MICLAQTNTSNDMKKLITICLSAIMVIALAQTAFAGVGEAPWNTEDGDHYLDFLISQIKGSFQWKHLDDTNVVAKKLDREWMRDYLEESGNSEHLNGCFWIVDQEVYLSDGIRDTIKFEGELQIRYIVLDQKFPGVYYDIAHLKGSKIALLVDNVLLEKRVSAKGVSPHDFVIGYDPNCEDGFWNPGSSKQKDLTNTETEGDGGSSGAVKTSNGKPVPYEGTGALKNLGQTISSGSDDASNVVIINNYGGDGGGPGYVGGVMPFYGSGWNITWGQYATLSAGFGFYGGGFGYYQYPPLALGDPWLPYALQNQQFQYAQAGYLGSGSSPALTYQGGGYYGGGTFGGTTVIYGSGGTQGPRDGGATVVTGGGGQQPRSTAVTTETLAEEFFAELDASPRVVIRSSSGTMQNHPVQVSQPRGGNQIVNTSGLPGMGQTTRIPSTQVTTQQVSSFQQVVRPQTGTTAGRQVAMPATQVARSPQVVSGTMPAAVQPARQVARPMVQPVARPAAVQPARMAAPITRGGR